MKIHWLSNHPNIYNDFLFCQIAAHLNISLHVYFAMPLLDSHPWKSEMGKGFSASFLKNTPSLDWEMLRQVFHAKRNEFYVIGGWGFSTFLFAAIMLRLKNRRFAIWSDTPNLDKKRSAWLTFLRFIWLRFMFGFNSKALFFVTGNSGVKKGIQMGILPQKLINFPFSTDLDFFKPDNAFKQKDTISFISSGRLNNTHKGHDLAIRAFSLVIKKGFSNFQFSIAGSGPDEAMLRSLVQENGLENQIKFVGWKEPEQLPAFYNSAHILLHTSHFDPFPNTVLEAMACGLPVIGSAQSGSVMDRVVNGENGFIHRSGDVADIASKILFIMNNPDKIASFGENARQMAEQWAVERQIQTLIQAANLK